MLGALEWTAGADHQLAASRFRFAGDFSDRLIGVLEHFTEHEDDALFRLKFFEKVQKTDR
jgi:hypothetical protein